MTIAQLFRSATVAVVAMSFVAGQLVVTSDVATAGDHRYRGYGFHDDGPRYHVRAHRKYRSSSRSYYYDDTPRYAYSYDYRPHYGYRYERRDRTGDLVAAAILGIGAVIISQAIVGAPRYSKRRQSHRRYAR